MILSSLFDIVFLYYSCLGPFFSRRTSKAEMERGERHSVDIARYINMRSESSSVGDGERKGGERAGERQRVSVRGGERQIDCIRKVVSH